LFRLADLSTLWLTVHAFERDAVRIQPGALVRVSFPALPGRSFTGRVAYVGRVVDPSSRTIPVRVDLPNPEDLLRPGMSATAWVKLGGDDDIVLAVPAAALQRVRGEWSVFIPRGDGSFQIRAVGRGRELDGEVELLSGVTAGETIVIDGAFLLKAEADKAHGAGSHDHAH
jgi:cobalt-zinc-cadmium efflux system membrane fusion protein